MNGPGSGVGLRPLRALAMLCVFAYACGDDAGDGPADATARSDAAIDAARDAFVAPRVDPSLFDCTAAGAPTRASTRPLHCALDPECSSRLVSAHRGAGAPGELAPEDTLSAFRAAIAAGADLTELDVRLTADEQLVVIHDETVDRTTDGTGAVAELTLAELQALAVDADRFTGDFSCERVPTFAEVLALTAGRITTIVDGTKTDRIDLVVAAIADAGALDEVILDADPAAIEAALVLEPTLPFFVRATSIEELAVLDRFEEPATRYVHIGSATGDDALREAVVARGQRLFALAFAVDVAFVIGGDDSGYLDLWESGVQMLQTNRPEVVTALLP